MTNRRFFIKTAGLGIAAASVPAWAGNAKAPGIEKQTKIDVKLGIASYSLREFSVEQALDMTLRCGIKRITFKSMHLPLDSDLETIKKTLALCKEKGIILYGGGVIAMRTEADVDQAFEYAKAAEMLMIIGDPSYELLEYVEEKVKAYDIKLAIHNHGPGEYTLYPSAVDAYEKIKDMDRRMGLCVDIGHTVRIQRDPVRDIKTCFDRVFDIHIKDVSSDNAKGETVTMGHGVIDIVAFLQAIVKMKYTGTLALEYESEKDDPLPAMMESFGYVRGILAAL